MNKTMSNFTFLGENLLVSQFITYDIKFELK